MKQPSAVPIEITIEIANQQPHLPVQRRLLRRAVRRVLRAAGVRKARISVAVVDDETTARLNWQFLRHRGPADVLSFVLDESDGLEGEVIAGAQVALRSAPRYGWPPHDELLLYIIHGTLHLVGHDDTSPSLRAEMRKRETEILEDLGVTRKQGNPKFENRDPRPASGCPIPSMKYK